MRFKKQLESFKEHLFTNNYSERTIEKYYGAANKFFFFVEKYYQRINSIEQITKDIVRDYQNYMANSKSKDNIHLTNRTQRNRLIAIRQFFQYLLKEDLILNNPAKDISLPKGEDTIIRNTLTEDEVKKILQNIKLTSPVKIRNRAIVEIFYACGVRTTELCNLKTTDIDFKEQTVTIFKGKGKKSRIVPLTQYAVEYTKLYLEKARRYFLGGKRNDPGYLFLTNRGNPFDRSSINKCVIRSILRGLKFKKHISAYCFRHSIATHLLANHVDISYIAQLLGHSSLNTTQRYTRIEISDLKKIHSLTHPREKV